MDPDRYQMRDIKRRLSQVERDYIKMDRRFRALRIKLEEHAASGLYEAHDPPAPGKDERK